jgi:hypothetical protein
MIIVFYYHVSKINSQKQSNVKNGDFHTFAEIHRPICSSRRRDVADQHANFISPDAGEALDAAGAEELERSDAAERAPVSSVGRERNPQPRAANELLHC